MKTRTSKLLTVCCFIGLATLVAEADAREKPNSKGAKRPKMTTAYASSVPKPTLSGVRYGTHERHILDFWKASSPAPTPLVFVIHGGGWSSGSKERLHRFADTAALLKAGISVVAINYRLMAQMIGNCFQKTR